MTHSIKKNNQLVALVLISMLYILVIVNYILSPEANYLYLYQLIFISMIAYFYRKNSVILVFLIFAVSYLYIPKYFFHNRVEISFHSFYQTSELMNLLVVLNILFFMGFVLGLRQISDTTLHSKNIVGRLCNSYAFYIFILILLFALNTGLSGDSIFQSGGYGRGSVAKTTLYEYFIVFYLVAVLFLNPKSKLQISILVILFFMYTIKSIIYGGRIEFVQLSLLVLFLWSHFFKSKIYLMYLLILLGAIFNHAIGNLRNNPSLIADPASLMYFNFGVPDRIQSQFGDVVQSSLRILGLIDDFYLSTETRLQSFALVVFGLAPSKYMPDFYNLARYRQDVASSGGGGLISAYSYAWISYMGPIIFGFFIGTAYRWLYNSNNILLITYGLMVAISFPRWFAYYPIVLFKFCLLVVFILFIYLIVRSAFGKSRFICSHNTF